VIIQVGGASGWSRDRDSVFRTAILGSMLLRHQGASSIGCASTGRLAEGAGLAAQGDLRTAPLVIWGAL